ncbi:uncharacterized protein LOC105431840 [Pogonomyrmex barbatus]|uniref:Uncharacterized protein LOC105431840 n=1 Tax=Pogonomyrmex barbatus TaxID=144034 RepID=A0A8N1S9A8_9HYME|nr:uncharacterized protein LOC105431840 [Pogonomyrmex barbatus]
MLDDKKFDVDKDDSIIIDNRLSDEAIFTEDDKQTYKSILLTMNAHRRGHSAYNPIMSNKRYKYINIIAPLISTYKKSGKKGAGYIPCSEDLKENWNIKKNVQQMLRMQARSNIILQDINQRLQKIESILKKQASNSVIENNDGLIVNFLPLSTVQRIKEFESLLKSTEEAVTQFKQFLLRLGGNNLKDNILRILIKTFTNECAMNCSMKGIRNNFRVEDLKIMRVIRNILSIIQSVSVKNNQQGQVIKFPDDTITAFISQTEFDGIVAKWLHFAKQRKERDDKIKESNKRRYVHVLWKIETTADSISKKYYQHP